MFAGFAASVKQCPETAQEGGGRSFAKKFKGPWVKYEHCKFFDIMDGICRRRTPLANGDIFTSQDERESSVIM
jgi:hypothetical protein